MKNLTTEECNRDLAALDAAEKLTAALQAEIDKFKEMKNPNALIKKAMGMLMTGNISLEGLGLPANLFEQIEQLEKLNSVARRKYRARVIEDFNQLNDVEEIEPEA